MRATWLADVLHAAGCKVHETPGWQDRGKDLSAVLGIVWHHDAAHVNATDEAVDRLLIGGRPDLPGPLSQCGLRRDGTWVLIAAGRANHNGYGQWGNQSIGIEARNNGIGQDWPDVQVQSWVKGTAAICAHLKLSASQVKGHKETDPKRKIDPAGLDMNAMRQRIAPLITYRPPTDPTPEPPKGPLMALSDAEQTELLAKVREIHGETVVSRDDKNGKKASMRWLIAKIAKGEKVQ